MAGPAEELAAVALHIFAASEQGLRLPFFALNLLLQPQLLIWSEHKIALAEPGSGLQARFWSQVSFPGKQAAREQEYLRSAPAEAEYFGKSPFFRAAVQFAR